MPTININGVEGWVPRMSPKGQAIYLSQSEWRYLLLHGPRQTTKSNTAIHLLISHCWENDGATAVIIVKGIKASVASGCWKNIVGEHGVLEKEWFTAGIGCEWAKNGTPRMLNDTKMRYCLIKNRHGGTSEIQLHTLQDAAKADSFKDSEWSFIYLVEADRWEDADVLNKLIPQLRGQRVPFEKQKVVIDCNPPRTGEDHWLYTKFIRDLHGRRPRDVDPFYMEVGFVMDDNPFIPDAKKLEIYKANEADQTELDRNYYGRWVKSKKGTAFGTQYIEGIHRVGDRRHLNPSDRRYLLPLYGTHEFVTGWDLGDAMNHASVIGCKVYRPNGQPVIFILDELVKIGVNTSIEDYTIEWMLLYEKWTKIMAKRGASVLDWKFWCDETNLRYQAAAGRSTATSVYQFSKGIVNLDGVARGDGSVDIRAQLLRRALFGHQIFIDSGCTAVLTMLSELKYPVDKKDPHKHVFDALTYMLGRELPFYEHNEHEDNSARVFAIHM